ncbi:neurofascin-like isoform X2 [Pecten maximus]|uniref:neurofascin-like isoform X2 n=1 Tax=Pecten maximus TaxID=6579 RepID=UPI00145833C7|nr:neurofascin-like isoform X2 [Pecten maximus]XP_033727548.1 neurofascin-like isoform X2 [Pecten maximus]XP_033727549.1 neurofascin-like isoform X2 [Pecten maximus]
MFSIYLLLLGSSVLLSNAQLVQPPSMKSTFQQTYYLADHGKVEFSVACKASGNPTYRWEVDGITIHNHMFRNLYSNGSLFISVSNDTFSPYGVYQCFANNSAGSAMSIKFTLTKPRLTGFPTSPTVDLPRANEYDYQRIKCNSRPTCKPDWACSTEWKIGTGTENSIDSTGPRVALDGEGTLHFLYLLRTDQLQSGLYYGCGVWNQVMSLLTKGSHTTLSITSVDNPGLKDMELKYNRGATGTKGKSAELQCIFSGYPLPTITWFDENDDEIVPGSGDKYMLLNYNRILRIKNLTPGDEMNYKCWGTQNYNGVIKKSAVVFLNVTGPPQANSDQMQNVVKPIGTAAKFYCNTTSLPGELEPAVPTWYFNGALITEAEVGFEQRYRKEANGKVLIVNKVQKTNTGSFQCMTSNSEGVFMRDATLVVIDPIVVTYTPPEEMELLPEEVKYLAVDATTDPLFTLKYSWSFTNKDGDIFYNNDVGDNFGSNFPEELVLSSDRSNLTLNGANLEGGEIFKLVGSYKLRVFHDHEEKTYFSEVTTDDSINPAPVVVTTAGGFNPIIIAIILGVIVLFIVIFLIVCLLYRNRGGTYPLDKKELAAGHDPEKELANSGFHDLSRADGFDDEKPTNDRMSLNDSDKDYDSDDDLDQEYGIDFDTSKFNEDGSFIGQYTDSKRHPPNQSVV